MMKKIITLFSAALLWSGLSFAQNTLPHADISVQLTRPSADTTIASGDSLYVSFNYTNNGPDMLPSGDTLFFDIGGLVIYSILFQPMLPGNTFVYNDVAYFYNPTDSTLSFDLCLAILPQSAVQYTAGGTPVTTYIDDDSTNDINCHHVILQGPDSIPNAIQKIAASSTTDLQTYPNPVTDRLHFDLPTASRNVATTVIVSDMMGKTVLSQNIGKQEEKKYSLNVSELPTGVYLMKVQSGIQTWHAKFVKK